MNACRIAILMPVLLALFAGLATAQTPSPAVPVAGQPAAATLSPDPAEPAPAMPTDPSASQIPGPADPFFPPAVPGAPSAFPNLNAAPPDALGGLGVPAAETPLQQPENPLATLFDSDGDGVLSRDEVEDAPERLWELDRNLDARLSADELALVLAPRWQQRRRAVRGYLPEEPAQVQPVSPAPAEPPRTGERPRFEVYPLRGLDAAQTLATLRKLLEGQPDARLTFDARTQSILALAQPTAHAAIRDTLAGLLEGERTGVLNPLPGTEQPAAAEPGLPVVPRVVPLYNARSREILRIIRQIYRDRIVEPRTSEPAGNALIPGMPASPLMETPTVPAGKMVVGEGAEPNTIVVSAEDPLFFEVLDLIERLDETRAAQENPLQPPPGR